MQLLQLRKESLKKNYVAVCRSEIFAKKMIKLERLHMWFLIKKHLLRNKEN